LTGLYRGLDASSASAHLSGAVFCLLDSAILQYELSAAQIGQTIYLKLQSFNVFGGGLQDLATCAVYSHLILGSGAIGPVAATLAVGAPMDYGLANQIISERDDFGSVSAAVNLVVDLGTTTS
jgi:hypothetical protein